MVIMAGMLPGVECARRRRLRQGASSSAEAPTGTRRSSFCLYVNGRDALHAGSGGSKRSSVGKEMMHGWTLDSNAREAKERLDQKLRGQRESVIKRHHSTGSIRPSKDGGTAEGGWPATSLQREVFSKKGGRRRFRWSKLGWEASEQAECAVCLEEFRTGDILVHLPCDHRFHWTCAVPWLETSSRCPVCRAATVVASSAQD